MSDAAPPPWVKAAPGLSAAHKFMLGVLWGYGPYAGREELWIVIDGDRQPRQPARCWEPCSKLAELTDQPEATVRKQLRRLDADGWIERGKGSMRTLAWRAPGVFAYGALSTSGQEVSTRDPSTSGHPPVHERTPPVHEGPPRVSTSGPQTLQELSNSTSTNADAARAQGDTLDKCGLCTLSTPVLGTWSRHVHPDCPTHRDFKPDTPTPEEHTHGDTHTDPEPPRVSEAHGAGFGARNLEHAVRGAPGEHAHPAVREAEPAMRDQHAGWGALPKPRRPVVPGVLAPQPPPEPGHADLPTHVKAIQARATAGAPAAGTHPHGSGARRDARELAPAARESGQGARGSVARATAEAVCRGVGPGAVGVPAQDLRATGRLSPELAEAVAAAGDVWGVRLGEARFAEDVAACVDDLGLTPEELTRALQAWETWDRSERPRRGEVLWSRAASRAWVKRAAGLEAKPKPARRVSPWTSGIRGRAS
jgi:hypothetical protein